MAWKLGQGRRSDRWTEAAERGRSMSKEWRRKAGRAARQAAVAGHQTEETLKGWWTKLRPKVIEFEHRFGDVAIKVGKRAKRAS